MNLDKENFSPEDQYGEPDPEAQEAGAENTSSNCFSSLDLAARGWVALDIPTGVMVPEELPPTMTVRSPLGARYFIYDAGKGRRVDCDIYDADLNITAVETAVIVPPSPGYVLENDCEPVPLPASRCAKAVRRGGGGAARAESAEPFRRPECDRRRGFALDHLLGCRASAPSHPWRGLCGLHDRRDWLA